ncbi:unnamed protein product, partial [Polarella glacialis]
QLPWSTTLMHIVHTASRWKLHPANDLNICERNNVELLLLLLLLLLLSRRKWCRCQCDCCVGFIGQCITILKFYCGCILHFTPLTAEIVLLQPATG